MSDNCLYNGEIRLSRGWYEFGINNSSADDGRTAENVAFSFIAYWIAFNAAYSKGREYGKSGFDSSERIQISDYIKSLDDKTIERLERNIKFDSSRKSLTYDFMSYPVFDGKLGINENTNYRYVDSRDYPETCRRPIKDFKNLTDSRQSYSERLISLFYSIYKVRCNLFHGSKNPEPERDYRLVDSSQKILRIFLETAVFHKNVSPEGIVGTQTVNMR